MELIYLILKFMSAKSKKQRMMMAIAEHHPEMLYKRNKGVLKMTKSQMHDFATTSEESLPRTRKSQKRRKYA